MSDLLTTYTTFSAIDYKGENILSSYSLSTTPFTFVSDLPAGNSNKVLWSFGDGTTSSELCARKSYSYPGEYTVNLFVYDCIGNVRVSSYSQVMTIHDFLPLTFEIVTNSGYDILSSYTGRITGPLTINAQYPIYQKPIDIFYQLFGSESDFYSISANKFAHLILFKSLFHQVYNYSLSSYQYQEIDKITPETFPVFGKIVSDGINLCPSTDDGAFYVGMSGQKQVYFKFDTANSNNGAKFNFDKTEIHSPFVYDSTYVSYFNNLGILLSSSVTENVGFSALSITSNGMHGEGFPIESFDISPIKFENVKIPFVVKIIDQLGFSVKTTNPDTFSFVVLSGSVPLHSYYYSISSLSHTLSSISHNGSQRYYVKFSNLTNVLSNVSISAAGQHQPIVNDGMSINTFGQSTLFDVYPFDYYEIYKKNENFDAEENYKSLRFQETLLDKNVLFEDFLGTIVGGASANHESLGRKIYEKIANFVENTNDIDRNEIFSLLSQMDLMNNDVNVYDSTLMNYPEQIKRILSLASISKNRLIGTPNKFKENFDHKGHTQKDEYGINLGTQIDTDTYTITAGTPIVALEKFSGNYTLLNTYQPLCASTGATYKLSSYSSDWGWPLVLPSVFSYSDFSKYYFFFEYIDQYDSRNTDFTIDFANPLTTMLSTVSNDDLFRQNGIFENMIASVLYDSLSLFTV